MYFVAAIWISIELFRDVAYKAVYDVIA